MRQLTPEELELIVGSSMTTVRVTATTHYPTFIPTSDPWGGNPPSGGSGGGGGGGIPTNGASTDTCYVPHPYLNRVDGSFIFSGGHEGGIRTTGYTLPAQFPRSGETIGAGVDLGYHTAAELESQGVTAAVATSLGHWYGYTNSTNPTIAHIDATYGHPSLSSTDATNLSNSVLKEQTTAVQKNFDAASRYADFYTLPLGVQTAIVDVAYPSGPNLASSAPKFWSDITTGNWAGAVYELNHWKADGTTDQRHIDDANQIQKEINAQNIPKNDTGGFCP